MFRVQSVIKTNTPLSGGSRRTASSDAIFLLLRYDGAGAKRCASVQEQQGVTIAYQRKQGG